MSGISYLTQIDHAFTVQEITVLRDMHQVNAISLNNKKNIRI
jgi:hypothetical protein